ncbi:hypothetical protein MRX96_059120 [Rhipicephalus microplus]
MPRPGAWERGARPARKIFKRVWRLWEMRQRKQVRSPRGRRTAQNQPSTISYFERARRYISSFWDLTQLVFGASVLMASSVVTNSTRTLLACTACGRFRISLASVPLWGHLFHPIFRRPQFLCYYPVPQFPSLIQEFHVHHLFRIILFHHRF